MFPARPWSSTSARNDGVNVGEVFEVLRIVREVKDPVTKETLDVVTEKTGEMTITSVRDKIATGTYTGSAAQGRLHGAQENSSQINREATIMNRKLLVSLLAASATLASAQTKKALIIEPFDYSTVMTGVQAIFGTQQNIGTGIAAMLTTRVTQDGKFTVVERRKVANLTKEQDFAASNRVKQGTGARVGQIRGADLTLMGDIVVFGRDDRKTSAGVGAIVRRRGRRDRRIQGRAKAVVVHRLPPGGRGDQRSRRQRRSARRIQAHQQGLRSGHVRRRCRSRRRVQYDQLQFRRDHHRRSHHGRRQQALAADRSRPHHRQRAAAAKTTWTRIVADVDGTSLTINAGSAAGLAKGQTFTIYHKGKEIKDPKTGEVLDVQTTPIGTLTITNVRDRISTGTFAPSGGPAPVVGDVVRK